MKMKGLTPLIRLLYPETCCSCNSNLYSGESLMCTNCRHDLPRFENYDYRNNRLSEVFKGRISLELMGAFLNFYNTGKTKNLVHQLKYHGRQEIGTLLGYWVGNELKKNKDFQSIDCVVPVPLHSKKLRKRGYNQLSTFGETLASVIQANYESKILVRSSFTNTQTFKGRFDRFLNTETKFTITDLNAFSNQHILLIDDVITTGATIESCYRELQKTKGIKISVFAMAYTI